MVNPHIPVKPAHKAPQLPSTDSDGFTIIGNDSLKRRMDKLMVPRYISQTDRPNVPRTRSTRRFHALCLDLFCTQPRPGSSPSDKPGSKVDLVGTGVYRTVKVPENYSITHLAALVCFLMGWPLETSYDTWVRDGVSANGGGIEVWFCLVPTQVDNKWTVLPKENNNSLKAGIKLSEVWNPYNLMSNRLRPFSERPYLIPGALSVRVQCAGASLHSPSFSIDEPFAINGYGAPPASRLPRLRNLGHELRERCATKKFEGWAFSYGFWDFVEGRSVSEVDVEGVHVWDVDSDRFMKRLEILERREAGNWIADIEEYAVEFESDFMVIPKCIDAF